MKCQECRAHLLPVPLSYWMGPEEPPIPPAANLKSWWHIRDLCQIDTENLQQTSRITANRDPGPDFPKFGVLLKNLHRYRLLQQARRKRKATYAPTNNGNLALADHICCSPRYGPGHRPGTRPRPIVCLLLTAGLGRGGPGGRRHAPQPAPPRSATRHRARNPGRRPPGALFHTLTEGLPATPDTSHRAPSRDTPPLTRPCATWMQANAGGNVGVLPRTCRRSICDSRNPSRPSVTVGQPVKTTQTAAEIVRLPEPAGEHAVSRRPGGVMSAGGCVQGLWMNCAICPDGGAMPGDVPADPGGHAPSYQPKCHWFDRRREDPEGIEPMPTPDSYPHVTCGCSRRPARGASPRW